MKANARSGIVLWKKDKWQNFHNTLPGKKKLDLNSFSGCQSFVISPNGSVFITGISHLLNEISFIMQLCSYQGSRLGSGASLLAELSSFGDGVNGHLSFSVQLITAPMGHWIGYILWDSVMHHFRQAAACSLQLLAQGLTSVSFPSVVPLAFLVICKVC